MERMLDISDGDYLLESLRDFKPPVVEQAKGSLAAIFESKNGGKIEMQFIGGSTSKKKSNDDSMDALRFFEKPADNEFERGDGGFARLVEKTKGLEPIQDNEDDSDSFNTSKNKTKKSDFDPVAQYRKKKKAKQVQE